MHAHPHNRADAAPCDTPSLRIENVRLVQPGEGIQTGSLRVKNGRIAEMHLHPPAPCAGESVMDGGGRLLTPGLVDVHTHGLERVHYEQGAEALRQGSRRLPAYGVTTFVPTVVPHASPTFFALLRELADALPSLPGAAAPGLHLEGPFVAIAGAACERRPGDLGYLHEMLEACRQRVTAMSISPETPNVLPVIEALVAAGIVPFITHTRASVEATEAAIAAGARHATHFYDVFPAPPETDPGVRPSGAVEAILADLRVTLDVVADGCHIHPTAIRMALRAKTWQGVMAISDSNIGAGLPPGEYATPWGYPVRVGAGQGARIADPKHPLHGALAGSALTLNRAMANLVRWCELPEEQVWAMGTLNPARLLRLPAKGRLAPGMDADLVLWNDDMTPAATWVAGRQRWPDMQPTA